MIRLFKREEVMHISGSSLGIEVSRSFSDLVCYTAVKQLSGTAVAATQERGLCIETYMAEDVDPLGCFGFAIGIN